MEGGKGGKREGECGERMKGGRREKRRAYKYVGMKEYSTSHHKTRVNVITDKKKSKNCRRIINRKRRKKKKEKRKEEKRKKKRRKEEKKF